LSLCIGQDIKGSGQTGLMGQGQLYKVQQGQMLGPALTESQNHRITEW